MVCRAVPRQRLGDRALHDLNAQGFQFASDDIDSGAPRVFRCLGALNLPLARGIEVADISESIRPISGDRADIRPGQARAGAAGRSGLGGAAGLGCGLFVKRQTGIGAASAIQRIGEVAEARPTRAARRSGCGGGLQMREQRGEQEWIAGAVDDAAGEFAQPVVILGLHAINQRAAADRERGGHVLVLERRKRRRQPLGVRQPDAVFAQAVALCCVRFHSGAAAFAHQFVATQRAVVVFVDEADGF